MGLYPVRRVIPFSHQFDEVGGRRDVFDDLGRLGADAEVAEVGELVCGGQRLAMKGDVEEGLHHRGDVALRVFREGGEGADL